MKLFALARLAKTPDPRLKITKNISWKRMASLSLQNVPRTKAKEDPERFKMTMNDIQMKKISKSDSLILKKKNTTASTRIV